MAVEADPEEAVEGDDRTCELTLLISAYDEHYTYTFVLFGENLFRGRIHSIPASIFISVSRDSLCFAALSPWRGLVECSPNIRYFSAPVPFLLYRPGVGEIWNLSPGGKIELMTPTSVNGVDWNPRET